MKNYINIIIFSIQFQSQKEIKRQEEYQAHRKERKEVRRSAGEITKGLKQKPKYWMGKRVK